MNPAAAHRDHASTNQTGDHCAFPGRHGPPASRRRRAVRSAEDSPIYDGWTVRDLLAHIAAWDRELARGIDQILTGRRPAVVGYREADFNARAVTAARALPFADVLAELRAAHETLVGRIEALTDEGWHRPSSYRWGNQTWLTAASLFSYTYKGETHYGGHAREIEEWAGRQT